MQTCCTAGLQLMNSIILNGSGEVLVSINKIITQSEHEVIKAPFF